jgi:mxaJ protein
MSLRFLSLLLAVGLNAAPRLLRVCAEPNNMPFSNEAREGLENRVADLVARELGATLEYTWWPQRRGFVRKSLNAGRCDLLLGVPAVLDSVLATKPYYRSTYVFVSRKDRNLNVASLNDPALDQLKIGLHVVGDDYAPPAHVLARRGLGANLVGYSLFGGADEVNPPARLIEAVGDGKVDVAVVWGPFAGYFVKHGATAFEIKPVLPQAFLGIPFSYDISAAVRKGDEALKREVEQALAHECRAIQELLKEYGVPEPPGEKARCD